MAEKTFEEMVDETGDKIEELFEGMLTPKQRGIFYDILTLTFYRAKPSHSEHSEHEITQTLEAMKSCKEVLAYGDKIIQPIKPTFLDPPLYRFGAN